MNFLWISVIRLPDFVKKADFDWAVEAAALKKKIPTDEMLDKLHDMYMEGLPTPQKVEAAIKHIRNHAGKELYNEIEDDLSVIMDHFEVRGFKLGIRVGFKMVIAFSQEELNG